VSNVIQFPGRKAKAPAEAPFAAIPGGEEKMAALDRAVGDEDLGWYVYLLKSYCERIVQNQEGVTAEELLRDNIAYFCHSPKSGVVNFELFGWGDETKRAGATRLREYMKLFCKIQQTRIEARFDHKTVVETNARDMLLALSEQAAEKAKPADPLAQHVFPVFAFGSLVGMGARVVQFRRPADEKDRLIVVFQDHRRNTEYRMEVWYSALKGDSP